MQEYALYHGDDFMDLGTLDFLAKKFHFKINTLKWYSYPSNRKRSLNSYQVIKLEDDNG